MARKKSHETHNQNDDDFISPDRWGEYYRSAILRPDLVRTPATYSENEAESAWWDGLTRVRHIGWLESLEEVLRTFSPGERFLLYILSAIFGLSALLMVGSINALATVTVPSPGGSLVEGEVGSARFLNPLLTLSTPDEDITALVYSGLMRHMPDGSLIPDLAESYTVSSDGRTYTFALRPGLTFQDGSPVTAEDVAFTVETAQNPSINSTHRADWAGVVVSTPDARTVVFTLPRAYAPFIENTTLGILPKHLWENVSAEEFPFSTLNTHPVGSGPYKIDTMQENSTGAASRIELVPFDDFALGAPYVKHITFIFFANTAALIKSLNAGTIDAAAGLSPEDLSTVKRDSISIGAVTLPRVFGVFFNQSHNPLFADPSVRQALDAAVDKDQLVKTILTGRGSILNSPIPPGLLDNQSPATPEKVSDITSTATTTQAALVQNAQSILQKGGWKMDTASSTWSKGGKTLAFTITTADQPELVATVKAVIADWAAIGVPVTLEVHPITELNTTIIRPRNYDALLFGEVVGPELDLYAFWHSSQRNDPGLNLAMYANSKTDALLAQARTTTDTTARNSLYKQFEAAVVQDTPAVFLYSPDFLYIVPDDLQGVQLGALRSGAERFENVYQWYMDTENVWSIFAPRNAINQ